MKWSLALLAFATLTVHDLCALRITVPEDYNLIQDAILFASDGDTISVFPGYYHESLDFLQRNLVLESTAGAELTTINADLTDAVITIDSANAVIRGFTLTGGLATLGNGPCGGALSIRDADVRVEQNRFVSNSAYLGGAICVTNSYSEIINNEFINNSAHLGGAVYALGGAPLIQSNTFVANTAVDHGYGGAVALESSSAVIRANVFFSNGSDLGGALSCRNTGPLGAAVLVQNSFSNNQALVGATIYLLRADVQIRSNIMAFSTQGEALYCNQCAPQLLCNNVFGNNGGDGICGQDLGGNFHLDPVYCDSQTGDLRLGDDSPCWNTSCGIIGSSVLNCENVAVGDRPYRPESIVLYPCYPNPFNPVTTVSFDLIRRANVLMQLYNIRGALIRELHRAAMGAGSHRITLDASGIPSGVYVVSLVAGAEHRSTKILLLK